MPSALLLVFWNTSVERKKEHVECLGDYYKPEGKYFLYKW